MGPNGGSTSLRVALVSSAVSALRAPLSVHIVLDTSGSMAGKAIEDAKRAAESVVDKLDPTDNFSMVTFSDAARLLVEGGAQLAAALLRAHLVDRLAWVHAPLLIGGDGVPAIAGFGLNALADAPGFERVSMEVVGEDVLTIFRIPK